jgi:hypothetical protein
VSVPYGVISADPVGWGPWGSPPDPRGGRSNGGEEIKKGRERTEGNNLHARIRGRCCIPASNNDIRLSDKSIGLQPITVCLR